MKYGERKYGGASLTLAVPKALPAKMRGHVIELNNLYTSPECRNSGDAAMLIMLTTAEADLGGFFLFMQVMPRNETDLERLLAFYTKNGFAPVQVEPLLMVRPPLRARRAA